jgi:5-methylcytosine-specific restriction enzyme A
MKCLKPRVSTPKPAGGWQPDSVRGNRHQRGYGKAWDQLRHQAMTRDCGLCQPCLRNSHTTLATQVDHIVPKAQGGSDTLANLQAICDPCHRTKTSSESNT